MAVYKVPQDVEADDKLIGPFSFRQFIYLIIVVIAGALAWALSQVFIPLFIIPVPIMIFFGALALPLRKDQPMEIYLAAIVNYYLKPRKAVWEPDGVHSLVEITVPKVIEEHLTKDLSQTEAERRLSYLATIVDTGGWAVRGVAAAPVQNSSMTDDIYFEAQSVPDIQDEKTDPAKALSDKLTQDEARYKQELMERMRRAPSPGIVPVAPVTTVAPQTPVAAPVLAPPAQTSVEPVQQVVPPVAQAAPQMATVDDPKLVFNPYPSSMHQSVVQPMEAQQPAAPVPVDPLQLDDPYADLKAAPAPEQVNTSEKPVSPDIIRLADNNDLSIETIAREADRIAKRDERASEEVVINLH